MAKSLVDTLPDDSKNGETVSAVSPQGPKSLRYVGPDPAPRIGNLPGVTGTKAANRLTQQEIAYVIETSAEPNKVAKWWTSD